MHKSAEHTRTIELFGRNEQLFHAIFDHSNDAIFVLDPLNDGILDVNARACDLFGYSREQLLVTPISTIFPGELSTLSRFSESALVRNLGCTDEIVCLKKSGEKITAEISVAAIDVDHQRCLITQVHELGERHSIEQALRSIVEGTATATGDQFFCSLVRELAIALQVRFAFVAELLENKKRVRTLAFWYDDHFIDNFEYDLPGSPCEIVAHGESVYFTEKVSEMFPREAALGIESYFGVPLLSADEKEQLGHLAVLNDKPMVKEFRGMALLKIFAARARAELERKYAEQSLRENEERLAAILSNATDAIITIDDKQRIALFNAAAEKMFRYPVQEIIGQSSEKIFSKRFGNLLKGYAMAVQPALVSSQQLWAPEGLAARRADGEEFPVEATISSLEVKGRKLYTVIMRDLTERKQAEEHLARLQRELLYLQESVKSEQHFGEILGESPAMKNVFGYVEQVAGTDTTVLLMGETGTGKGAIARTIHELSPRKNKLLVNVNCAALPGELVESELFGHEKGSFTGATAQRKGRFEMADGGTIFLDEVGELSAGTQAKLLRVLQEQEFERVGGTHSIRVNVRVVAATNRNLVEMVKAGTFRSDLYYRLHVFPLTMPPLRERKADIPLLARHFLRAYAKKIAKRIVDIEPKSLDRLVRYPWPGNVRELQNVIERAVVLNQGSLLEVEDSLGMRLQGGGGNDSIGSGTLEDVERAYIVKTLEEHRWIIEGERGAARFLGLNPSTLRSRMQKLSIRKGGQADSGNK